jgi:hypothetical protein
MHILFFSPFNIHFFHFHLSGPNWIIRERIDKEESDRMGRKEGVNQIIRGFVFYDGEVEQSGKGSDYQTRSTLVS